MKKFSEEKYRYVTFTKDGSKCIIAESTHRGKRVRGTAKCAPDDTYDEALGKRLAAARCNLTVATKRYNEAVDKLKHYTDLEKQLHDYVNTLRKRLEAENDNYNEAVDQLYSVESIVYEK